MAETRVQGHLYLDGYKLSGKINALELKLAADSLENTTIDKSVHTFIGGHKMVDCSFSGFYDYDSGTPNQIAAVIQSRIGSSSDSVVGISHPATQAEGDPGWQFLAGVNGTPLLGGETTGIASLSATFFKRGAASLIRSRVEAVGDKTATFQSTGSQIGVLGSGDTATWSVHCYAFNGTTLDLDLESDDNSGFTTAVVRDSATQITAANSSELMTLAGPIATDDYWRINATFVGTSFSLIVLLGGWGTLAGG